MSTVIDRAGPRAVPPPGLAALFGAFLGIALSGFGGVLPWARRMLVERRGWLSSQEFTDVLGLCQFLPGPNIINVSIAVGARFRGVAGALAAVLGLVLAPVALMCALGALYTHYGSEPAVKGAFLGVAAAAAGLIVAMAAKMVVPLLRARPLDATPIVLAGYLLVGVARLPLMWVLPPLAFVGIVVAWWRAR